MTYLLTGVKCRATSVAKKMSMKPRCTGSGLDVATVSVAVDVADPWSLGPTEGVRVSPVCIGFPMEGVDAFAK